MKKCIFVLLTIILVSCGPNHTKMDEKRTEENMCVLEFGYSGHDYIMFKRLGTTWVGVVHNPDCHCKGG